MLIRLIEDSVCKRRKKHLSVFPPAPFKVYKEAASSLEKIYHCGKYYGLFFLIVRLMMSVTFPRVDITTFPFSQRHCPVHQARPWWTGGTAHSARCQRQQKDGADAHATALGNKGVSRLRSRWITSSRREGALNHIQNKPPYAALGAVGHQIWMICSKGLKYFRGTLWIAYTSCQNKTEWVRAQFAALLDCSQCSLTSQMNKKLHYIKCSGKISVHVTTQGSGLQPEGSQTWSRELKSCMFALVHHVQVVLVPLRHMYPYTLTKQTQFGPFLPSLPSPVRRTMMKGANHLCFRCTASAWRRHSRETTIL